MSGPQKYWLHIQQPTVPHYRVPFFDAVAAEFGSRMRVSASRTVHQGPVSVEVDREYLDLEHECSTLFGGKVLWQHNMTPMAPDTHGSVAVISANPRYLSTLRFALLARRKGMGVVWWGHGWSPTSQSWRADIRRRLMTLADAVLLYSDAEAEAWRHQLPRTAVFGAQNAIDQSAAETQIARWTLARLQQFRVEQKIEQKKVLLFCGRLRTTPKTDLDLLLVALTHLIDKDPSYYVVIIGDGEDRPRLATLARHLGVEPHVRWIGEQYEEAAIAPWFLSALCFVYPGPIGLSILHAMGYGLPVVTHSDRRRHNPEIVALSNSWNGLEFTDGDARSLEQQILRLGENAELRAALAANAFATAHRNFTIQTMKDRLCMAVEHARAQAVRRH